MVDSEDEFTQLCSKLLKRVKKTRPPDSRDVPKSSTAARSKFKKTKPSATKSQAGNEDTKRDDQGITSGSDHEKSAERNEPSDCHGASSKTRGLQIQDHPSNVDTQRASSGRAGTEPPKLQDQPSVTHMVLERMQQFKRAVPIRMKSSTAEDGDPVSLSSIADLPESDRALTVGLPIDLNQQHRSLEDQGLFFCQLCQKDLTTMNSALREQHVNRCLDQDESLGRVSDLPSVPSCPLCGKSFSTEKSRASHLKRCAAKLEVPAQTLLQAVQRQNNETGPEVTAGVSRAKRKAGSRPKEPPKKRKPAQPGSEVEELLVAMALSRSMQEDTAAANIASGTGPEPAREVTVPVKKSRRKQKDRPPPLLLVQDPQAPMQRLQERMSLLLGEESEAIIIGRLPPSHFWDMEENQKAAWVRPQREGKRGVLWEISNLVENIELLNYYTKELNPFIIPWKPPPKLLNSQPRTMTRSLPSSPCAFNSTKEPSHGIPCRASPHLSSSQKERQALLDLAELAGEGMTLTQWNAAPTRAINSTGRDSVGSLPSSWFVPTLHEESIAPSRHLQPDAPLVHLAADFMEMVNNPHLSDAQLQTDCGEVLSVHMFVLYTRCPLLVEAVHSEGFWVDEAGTGRIQRFLLNDVSAEAALSFLRFLYCASSGIPAHCLAHVCELARRFGVTSLIETCERLVDDPQYAGTQGVAEEDEDDGEERAETFQGLLKSMWVDEGDVVADSLPQDGSEEEKADVEGVGEGELEEIYEFAATQRRITEDVCGGSSSEHDAGQLCMESDDCPLEVAVQTVPANGQQRYPEILAQLTAPPAPSDGVMPVNTSPVRLTSHRIETSPAKIPLFTPVSTIRVSVSAAQTCHPAVSVSRQLFGKPVSRNKSEHGRCTRYSPSPLDDTYNQMFSETCGEYAESSAISSSSANVNVTPPGDGKRPQKPLASLPQLGRSPILLPFPPKPQPLNKTTQKSPSNSHPRCRISAASPPTSRIPSLHFLASPERTQRTTPKSVASSPISRSPSLPYPASHDSIEPKTPKSVASSPISRSPSLPYPASPDSIKPKTPKSVASSPSSRSPIQRFLASPDSIQPPSPKSVASPPMSRFLASPDSIQPTTPKSVTSPVYSQPCSLPSVSFLSNSPQLQNSPLLASPRNSLSSLASPPNSQPQSLPSLASPPKSRPASLISTDSSPGKQRSLQSPSNSQHRTPRSSNRSPTRPNTSSPNTKTDEQGVILILSSDEESEPSVNFREALHTQRTCDTDACGGIKESPMSFLERRSIEGLGRLEMSSSTDTSWLIPATPLCHATAAHTSQNQASHQPLQRPNSSVSSKVALHDLSGSPSQAKSPISPPKSTPKSPGDRTTSKISPSVHNTPGERKTLSSFGSKGSHVPSSLPTSPASSSVFEVGDSDDDAPGSVTQPDPINHSFYIDYEPPIHMEDEMWLDREETPQRPTSIPEEKTPSPRKNSPGAIKPLLEVSPEESSREESLHAAALQSSSQSFLNPQLWDKWEEDDEGDDLPATLPLFERLNKIPDNRTKLKTPVSLVQKRELPPKVPITPLPSYSDMDTPVLKKELNRFGVRALPKKQMVLKLKEIFQYTHQVMSSGSDDEVPSSQQVQKQKHSSTSQPPRPARKEIPTGGSKVQNGPQAKRAKKLDSVCSVQEADEQPLTASQESTASSAAASDTSSLSQSSGGNEFETAFAEEDDEEPCAPSQEAGRQVATAEAVRRFIEEHPELYKRILMYQPLDLPAVQVELKQSGIKMAAGKLLDFLDAHCVTFTTAATRKEKKIPRRRKGGKRY